MSFNEKVKEDNEKILEERKQKIISFVSEKFNQSIPPVFLRDFIQVKELNNAILYYKSCKSSFENEKNSIDKLYSHGISDYDTAISDYNFIKKVHLKVYTEAIQKLNNAFSAINTPNNDVLTSLIKTLVEENEALILTIDTKIEELKEGRQKQYNALNAQVTERLFDPPSTRGSEYDKRLLKSYAIQEKFGKILPQHEPFPLSKKNANAWLAQRGLNKNGLPAGLGLTLKMGQKMPPTPGTGGKRTRRRKNKNNKKNKRTRRSC